MAIGDLGKAVTRKRGKTGLRTASSEIGVGTATLSRVERGHIPDLNTIRKICLWLGEPVSTYITEGSSSDGQTPIAAQIAFKKDSAVSPETAKALANVILAASTKFSKEGK